MAYRGNPQKEKELKMKLSKNQIEDKAQFIAGKASLGAYESDIDFDSADTQAFYAAIFPTIQRELKKAIRAKEAAVEAFEAKEDV